MKRSMKLFERLLDTDVKADLLTLFHNNPNLSETSDGLARRVGRNPTEVHHELEDLAELGILRKVEMYSFGVDRDKEIQARFLSNWLSEKYQTVKSKLNKPQRFPIYRQVWKYLIESCPAECHRLAPF